ncbi:MAG: protein kinase [Candidatus Obscuribacterales bacterium]|nr:protein kinase [Candidatus Obscuribacterales bacterium]
MSEPGLNSASFEKSESQPVSSGPPRDPLIGSIIDQRYVVLDFLGAGASANSYKVKDRLLERLLAAKVIHPHLLDNSSALERFKAEAVTTAALSHGNIAKVYSQGTLADNRPYMIMEFIEACNLEEHLRKNGPLEKEQFFEVFLQILDALIYAHEAGVVHRDLKPSNIMLLPDGAAFKAILLDFGIAKCLELGEKQELTQTGALLGSAAYMSPEQCQAAKDIDARTDIYTLACVMFESLTGRKLFEASSQMELMYLHLNDHEKTAASLKQVPPALSELLAKCLEKNRDLRFQSASELKMALQKIADSQETLKMSWPKSKSNSRKLFPALLPLILILAGLIALAFVLNPQASQKKTKAIAANFNKPKIARKFQSPEEVTIPQDGDAFSALVKSYYDDPAWGLPAAEVLLNRWKELYDKESTSEYDRRAAYVKFVLLYATKNNKEQALAYARKVFECDLCGGYSMEALSPLVVMYLNENKPAEVVSLIQEQLKRPLLADSPAHSFKLYGWLCLAHFQQGNYREAVKCGEKSMRLEMKQPGGFGQDGITSRLFYVRALLMNKQLAKATAIAATCIKSVPDSNPIIYADTCIQLSELFIYFSPQESAKYKEMAMKVFPRLSAQRYSEGVIENLKSRISRLK